MAKATKQTKQEAAPRGRAQQVTGEVVSAKMDKTISVKIYRRVRHAKYGKFLKKTSVFKAHDEKNEAKPGDTVRIQVCRPLSKTKRWRLIEITERGTAELEGVQI
jgi:small subunit ribosomal protein S17